jgi:hypothetical protein
VSTLFYPGERPMTEFEVVESALEFSASDAVGAILFFYWILAGIWLFFIADSDDDF